jgi:hypothetical protein
MRIHACLFACWLGACGGTPSLVAERPGITNAAQTKQWIPPPWTQTSAPPEAPGAPEPSEAARRVLETAQRMGDAGTVVRGSCYRYIDRVFDDAGHDGWRERTQVFRGSRNGPYADLDLIQPGDWLYIVNHPESRPVGTHSVLFVAWEDRANGYARVWSYVGGSQDRPADLVGYDVTRTYGIQRAIMPAR